jgi:hypothetical protein
MVPNRQKIENNLMMPFFNVSVTKMQNIANILLSYYVLFRIKSKSEMKDMFQT